MGFRNFASDNNAGVHPEILKAITDANHGHQLAYGDDFYTLKAEQKFKDLFGPASRVYFVYNGTGANVISLRAACRSFNSIICADYSHINVDECCAPEKFIGAKLITVPDTDGKINISMIERHIYGIGDPHHAQPKVISITQATEFGTVYNKNEIRELADFAHNNNMYLHMDGARIANAAVFLNSSLKEITSDCGIDILSFGGTKNGLMFGEAIVVFNQELSVNIEYFRKQAMQLNSKMRFIACQFEALLSNDLWKKNAGQANSMCKLLFDKLKEIPELKITNTVEANAIFVAIPSDIIDDLQKEFMFHLWDEKNCIARLMCSYDTSEDDIEAFCRILFKLLKKRAKVN